MAAERQYLAIDLKSFFASAECVARGLNPITTNLVVADKSRTSKTICLAVTPALKAYGIPGRARLFEVEQQVRRVNNQRRAMAPNHTLTGTSTDANELAANPALAVDFIAAPPRMAYYMQLSTQVYNIYLQYIDAADIHVYSVDEVFIDATDYLKPYGMTARELCARLVAEVFAKTGITATAGIGSNLYLAKIALDIMAKKAEPDENGLRIAELDEMSYRRELWHHRPLTDFWRVGRGYADRLAQHGMHTMGDVARCSLGGNDSYYNEALLYRLLGKNAELLIDHAWGWEPCRIADIKAYRPAEHSIGTGQVLRCPYDFAKTRLIVREMTEGLSLELVDKGLATDQLVLTIGYDVENLTDPNRRRLYHGEVTHDRYGRVVPKHAHGTATLDGYTSSTRKIVRAMLDLYERIADPNLLVRRVNVTANRVKPERELMDAPKEPEQLMLFCDYDELEREREREQADLAREKRMQQAMLAIKKKFGKNAILKGTSFEEGSTAIERNGQIGGHRGGGDELDEL